MEVKKVLERLSSQTDIPKEELQEEYEDVLDEVEGEKLAVQKIRNLAKRRARRIQALEDYKGVVIAKTEPFDTAQSASHEQYVRNALCVYSDTETPFAMTLWGKSATHLNLPVRREIEFKGSLQSDNHLPVISIPESAISQVEPVGEEVTELIDYKQLFQDTGLFSTLKDLEEYYEEAQETKPEEDKSPVPVMVQGTVQSMTNRPDSRNRFKVRIDDMSDLTGDNPVEEDFTTVIQVPEKMVESIELDSEIIVVGDIWKPNRRYDQELGDVVDEPGRVRINAWDLQVFPFGELLEW